MYAKEWQQSRALERHFSVSWRALVYLYNNVFFNIMLSYLSFEVITRMIVAHGDRFLEASMKSYVFALFVSSATSRAFIVVEKMLSLTLIIIIITISLYEQS